MRSWVRAGFGLLWLAWGTGAGAVALGEIQLDSGLGDPLSAAIPFDPGTEPLENFSARLASPDQYEEQGLVYSPVLDQVSVAIEGRGASPSVRLSSRQLIAEPALELLVELSWDGGRLLRRYAVLFNPPLPGQTPAARRPPN